MFKNGEFSSYTNRIDQKIDTTPEKLISKDGMEIPYNRKSDQTGGIDSENKPDQFMFNPILGRGAIMARTN